MKRLLDWNPLRLPVKGTWTTITATTIVFTSNTHPRLLYNGDGAWASRILQPSRYGTQVYKMEFQEGEPPCVPPTWLPVLLTDPANTL